MARRGSVRGWTALGACALLACAQPCLAESSDVSPAPASDDVAVTAPSSPPRVEAPNAVSALALQREGLADLAASPRLAAMPVSGRVPPHWSTSAELAGHAYRVSLSRGALDLGMGFDASTRAASAHGARFDAPAAVVPTTLPSVSVGLREGGDAPASSLLARATGDHASGYTSKVGVQWKPAESNVQFLRDGLGMRLDGNERITMKLRKGMLGVYLQRRF